MPLFPFSDGDKKYWPTTENEDYDSADGDARPRVSYSKLDPCTPVYRAWIQNLADRLEVHGDQVVSGDNGKCPVWIRVEHTWFDLSSPPRLIRALRIWKCRHAVGCSPWKPFSKEVRIRSRIPAARAMAQKTHK